LRWSPNGRFLAACDGNFVVLWRAAEPSDFTRTPQLRVHPDNVTDVAWSFDGSQLASVSKDGALMIGQPSDTKVQTIRTEQWLLSVAWNASADRVATGSRNGQLQVWNFDRDGSPAVQVGQRRTRLHGEYVEDGDGKVTGATRILDETQTEIADAELVEMAPHYGAGRALDDDDCQRYFGLSACRAPWSVRAWSWAFR
jgi:WD40 repeat protein